MKRSTGAGAAAVLLGLAAACVAVAAGAGVRGLTLARREEDPAPESPETTPAEPSADDESPASSTPRLRVVEDAEPVDVATGEAAAEPVRVAPAPETPSIPNRYYDEPTCRVLVAGLNDGQRERARALFGALARDGAITAKALAAELAVEPRQLPGLLITPLRRRADELELPLPFQVAREEGSSLRQWRDSGGVAARMMRALERAEPLPAAQP